MRRSPGKILVSACLMGHAVRYDGSAKPLIHPAMQRWQAQGRLVALCPEMSAGLPVPRPPAEIEGGQDGEVVLAGAARVLENTGRDVTAAFLAGAENALRLARAHDCRFALLIDGSPSCGSGFIYDGTFSGARRTGSGVVAALLRREGIAVYAHTRIEEMEACIAALEAGA